jgi:hypothetical protein
VVHELEQPVDRRSKKLIAVAFLHFFATAAADAYNCKACTGQEKKKRGCKRQRRKPIASFDCPVCKGTDDACLYCKNGCIVFFRCVRFYDTVQARALLPYFYQYLHGLKNGRYLWPNGRTRLYQPLKLIQAFDVLLKLYIELEKHYGCNKR